MDASQVWVAVAIVVLALVAVLVFAVGRGQRRNRLTPLAGLAFACVVAGIVLGDDRLIGYGLIGAGVALAIADAIVRSRM